jgi:hypothetical protein
LNLGQDFLLVFLRSLQEIAGRAHVSCEHYTVASHLKILIPVGSLFCLVLFLLFYLLFSCFIRALNLGTRSLENVHLEHFEECG